MPVVDPDKVFWTAVRRALLLIVRAIEVRHGLGAPETGDPIVYTRQTTKQD